MKGGLSIDSELNCKIFIDTNLEKKEIIDFTLEIINGVLNERLSFTMIESKYLDIEIVENEDFAIELRNDKENGFLYSKYYMEVEPIEGIDEESYISYISKLFLNFKRIECNIVIACNFEKQLPNNGYSCNLIF